MALLAGSRGARAPARQIHHVSIILRENHSFDTYFGGFPGAHGRVLDAPCPDEHPPRRHQRAAPDAQRELPFARAGGDVDALRVRPPLGDIVPPRRTRRPLSPAPPLPRGSGGAPSPPSPRGPALPRAPRPPAVQRRPR